MTLALPVIAPAALNVTSAHGPCMEWRTGAHRMKKVASRKTRRERRAMEDLTATMVQMMTVSMLT